MAFLISKQTVDTESIGPFCDYDAAALEGTPFISPNVKIGGVNGIPVPIYDATSNPSTITGRPRGTTGCTSTGQRIITPTVNTSVQINGRFPAVQGDNATLDGISTPRPLTGPWLDSTIQIGTSGGANI